MAKKKSPNKGTDSIPVGPLPLVKGRLQRVPLSGEIWEADFRQMMKTPLGAESVIPWIVIVGSRATGLIRGCDVSSDSPSTALLWDVIAKSVQEPLAGTPGRPIQLLVRDDPRWLPLRDHLTEIGIDLKWGEPLSLLNMVYEEMVGGLSNTLELDATPLLELPGMSVEKAASFFEASALFYKEKPWKRQHEENAIEIICSELGGGPWYGVIMGAAGETFGLALYDDLKWLEQVWTEGLSTQEQTYGTEATALTYGPRDTMLPEDLAAMKEHGWKSGGREGYPELYRKKRGQEMRTPTSEEIRVLDACLRAIPPFVKKRRSEDGTSESLAVASPSGTLTLKLRWVTDLRP